MNKIQFQNYSVEVPGVRNIRVEIEVDRGNEKVRYIHTYCYAFTERLDKLSDEYKFKEMKADLEGIGIHPIVSISIPITKWKKLKA